MSLYTVARDDFKNARRSYAVLGVIGVLTAIVVLIFAAEMNQYDHPYRTLFDVSFFLFLTFPIILAPLTYLSIAGDRDGGAIKYAMGLPNSRGEYVFGKLVSRLGVTLVAVALSIGVAFLFSLVTFVNAPDPVRFVKFALVSLLFAFSFVGIFVGVSAMTSKRSRAMLGVFGAYFVLVPFWFGFLPFVSLTNILSTATDLFGVTISENTGRLIQSLSPATSYLYATEIVYQGVLPTPYGSLNSNFVDPPNEIYRQFWFNALVMFAWGAVSLFAGYVSFRRSELG
ncbi:ABC transporter permease [Halobacterium litoreum]|uniref:ABC transporter permease n=1 Tax=Halobacterium litoreum TaxID=2039234 RepID=A0ABD5NG02_9EURY|nr:ABC transporter permease subunit [Halobacterium litoreum]UHH13259.1 ABC transporter permease [Halobacterium litoreum]